MSLSNDELLFLQESNEIENVYDEDSLQQAIYAWEYLKEQKELTSGVILKLHKILMLHQKLQPDQKGYFRRVQVWVGSREGADWRAVPFQVDDFCERVRLITGFPYKKKDAETMNISLHVQYETIHPFIDGNGRTGRMIMNWIRLNVLKLPLLIIYADERQEYYCWFK